MAGRPNAGLAVLLCGGVLAVIAVLMQTHAKQQVRRASTAEWDEERKRLLAERRQLEAEVEWLRESNESLLVLMQGELDKRAAPNITPLSWFVRKIDRESGLVWVGAGSGDDLQPETVLRVLRKDHHGIGRTIEDVKGTLVVTRIIGEHISEARILEEDVESPIESDDPIYCPPFRSRSRQEAKVFGGLGWRIRNSDRSDGDLDEVTVERADGKILNVDQATGLAWISRVAAGELQPGTEFRVLAKWPTPDKATTVKVRGVLVVNRVVDVNLAEVQILEQDAESPITAGAAIVEAGRSRRGGWWPGRRSSLVPLVAP